MTTIKGVEVICDLRALERYSCTQSCSPSPAGQERLTAVGGCMCVCVPVVMG